MRSKRRWGSISRSRSGGSAKYLFLLPGLSGVCFFVLIPFGDVVRRSFYTALSGEFVGLDNYMAVLQNDAFRLAAGNTLRFVGVCLPLLLLLSLGLALLLGGLADAPSGGGKGGTEKWKTAFLLPLAMPAATVALVWKLLFAKQGFLNLRLGSHVDFMAQNSAFLILVGSYLWKNMGYTLVLWMAGLKAVPPELREAARVDGAGRIQCFLRVILPGLKGSIYTITLISFLNSFKVFREAYLVSGPYPQDSIYLLQHVFNNWYVALDLDKMAAGAVTTALVLGSASMLLQRMWNK